MSSLNSDNNSRDENQKPTQVEENSSIKNNMDDIGDAPSGDAMHDSISPITKKIKISESGDNDNTLYLTCTEFDANITFIEPSVDVTLAESTLDSTITESNSSGSITNSSLDDTLAKPSFEDIIGELSMNSIFEIQSLDTTLDDSSEDIVDQVETITEPLDEGNNLVKEPVTNKSDKTFTIDNDATAYFSLESNSSIKAESVGSPSVVYKKDGSSASKKISNMFTEYRENRSFNMSETSSSFLLEESRLEESWLYDLVVDTNDQEDLKEIEILMSNLRLSKSTEQLVDEEDRSLENVNKIVENKEDEFGPDVATTNLLVKVRESLELYKQIEKIYGEREKNARSIVYRRFHTSLEEFLNTISEGIEKREGLDRYEWFLEGVEKSLLQHERRKNMKINLERFNTFPNLKNVQRPFQYQKDKNAYFLQTTYTAFYLHAAKVNKVLSQRRGYASV